MQEIAYHFSQARPKDVPEGVHPPIVQAVRDIPVGDPSVLIMMDLEIHGQQMEPHFGVSPRTERQVLPVPPMLTREALLRRARTFEYCRMERFRCLVEINHQPWPILHTLPRPIQHGDYVVIKIPPPRMCSAPTQAVLDASRNLEPIDLWTQYYVPSSPSASSGSSPGTVDDVSPSLIGSDEICAEFGNGNRSQQDADNADQIGLMQAGASSSSDPAPSTSSTAGALGPSVAHIVNGSCILSFDRSTTAVWPMWFRQLITVFSDFSVAENADEGPVLYISTWYADCSVEQVSEDSRVVRLDSHINLWHSDVLQAWQDKLLPGEKPHFVGPSDSSNISFDEDCWPYSAAVVVAAVASHDLVLGAPGNELVETLAWCAAAGHPLQDWSHFLHFTQQHQFVKALEWACMLFATLPDVTFDQGVLSFPAKPSTCPNAAAMIL
eukprot:s2367_g6.t1